MVLKEVSTLVHARFYKKKKNQFYYLQKIKNFMIKLNLKEDREDNWQARFHK
jgi:hypothetical protein